MNNEEGKIYYGLGIDNSELQADAAKSMSIIQGIGNQTVAEGARIDNTYKKIGSTIAMIGGAAVLTGLGREIVDVTAKFEKFHIVLSNTLGSDFEAGKSLDMVRDFVAKTPFQVDEVTDGFIRLTNQGFKPTYQDLTKLGDLASSTGKGFTQLSEAIIDAQTGEFERLKEFGIKAAKEGDKVTFTFKGQQTVISNTSASIKDYILSLGGMQGVAGANAKIADSVSGRISNIADKLTSIYSEIGTEGSGVINSALSGTEYLLENYKEIGEALAIIVATYGTYKAAVIATEAIHQSMNTVRLTEEAAELSKLLTVEQQAKISKLGLIGTSAEYATVVKAEVAANVQSAQSALIKARAEVSTANQIVVARRTEYIAAKLLEKQRLAELMSIGATGTAKQVEAAQRKLATAETQRETAAIAFQSASRDFGTKKIAVETAAKAVSTITTAADTAAQTANVTVTGILSIAKVKLAAIAAKLNAVIMANPYALAAAAVLALGYGIYKLVTYQTDAEKAQAKLNETVQESEKAIASERYQIDLMFARLQAAKKGTEEYAAAKQAIMNQYGSYLKKLGDEKTALNDIAAAYKLITEEAAKAARARAMEKATKDAADTVAEAEGDSYDEIKKLLEKKFKGKKGADGKDLSATYIMKFKPVIDGKENITQELENIITQFDKEKVFTDPETGRQLSSLILNPLRDELSSLAKARGIYQKTMDEALMKFGESPSNNGGKTEFDITKASLQQLMEELPKATGMLQELRNAENTKPEDITAQTAKISSIKAQIAARETELKVIKDVEEQIKLLQEEQKSFGKDDGEYKSLDTRIKALQTKLPKQGGNGGGSSKPKDYTDQLKQEKQEKERFYTDLGFAVRQAEINAMSEGLDKVLAQNDLNYRKEIEQIKRQKEDKLTKIQEWERTIWESQNPNWEKQGEKFKPQTTALSEGDNKQFEVMNKSAFATLTTGNKKAYEIALNEYADFAVSYIDKANEFEDNLKNLASKHKQERANLISSGASKEAIDQFDQKAKQEVDAVTAVQKELLAGLDEQMEVKSQTFILFAEQIANMGIQELKLKLDEAEILLAQAQTATGEDGDKTSVIEYQAQIRVLKQQIIALTKKSDKKEEATSGDALAKYKAALKTVNELGNAAKDIAGAFEGLDGDVYSVLDSIGTMSSSVGSMLSTIVLMSTTSQVTIAATTVAASTGVVATSTAASTAIQGVEKASVILAIIGAALQIITAIAKAISGLFNNDKKKEKEIKRLQEQVDALEASYKKLGKAIDKAYSADSAALIKEQDENLRKQKALIEEQIRLEESKKKTDNDKVNQWKQAIEEIDNELEETNGRVIEAIIGTDVKSAISEFADAYIDAWSAGEDKAAAMKDVVRKMVKSAVTELVKSRLSPEVTQFMEFLAKAMEDGILTSAEESALDEWERRLYAKAESIDQNFGKYIKDEDADKREASEKGFGAMSQDSADELNGRFTALQALAFEINENVKIMRENSKTIIALLTGIETNTGRLEAIEEYIFGVVEIVKEVRNGINDINLKGITLKR